jgi:hypothetical protein
LLPQHPPSIRNWASIKRPSQKNKAIEYYPAVLMPRCAAVSQERLLLVHPSNLIKNFWAYLPKQGRLS